MYAVLVVLFLQVTAKEAMSEPYLQTIAGTGESPWRSGSDKYGLGFSYRVDVPLGDGGPAIKAFLDNPMGLAEDSLGNLFIADAGNNRVRKIDRDGIITTVAGTGKQGFSGDGGLATEADLSFPNSVVVGIDDTVYLADTANRRIRKISKAGIISTVAGGGIYSGVFYPRLVNPSLAVEAKLDGPRGLAVDSIGRIYIAEQYGNRVHRFDIEGRIETLVSEAVVRDGRPFSPSDVAVASNGAVYITDLSRNRVVLTGLKLIDYQGYQGCDADFTLTLTWCPFAGNGVRGFSGDGGAALAAGLQYPSGIATDAFGNLYVAEGGRIRKIDSRGVISTIAGSAGTAGERFGTRGDGFARDVNLSDFSLSVHVSRSGDVYVVDAGNGKIRKIVESPPAIGVSGASGFVTALLFFIIAFIARTKLMPLSNKAV